MPSVYSVWPLSSSFTAPACHPSSLLGDSWGRPRRDVWWGTSLWLTTGSVITAKCFVGFIVIAQSSCIHKSGILKKSWSSRGQMFSKNLHISGEDMTQNTSVFSASKPKPLRRLSQGDTLKQVAEKGETQPPLNVWCCSSYFNHTSSNKWYNTVNSCCAFSHAGSAGSGGEMSLGWLIHDFVPH